MPEIFLADRLFMIAHDEVTGKPAVNPDLLGSGLAGALLADLVFTDRIDVVNNTVVLYNAAPTGESVLDRLLEQIGRQDGDHLVRTWVEHLRDSSAQQVSTHLLQRRTVYEERSRSLLGRTSVRYLALDPLSSAAPRAILGSAIERGDALHDHDGVTAALIGAMQAEQVLMLMWTRAQYEAAIQRVVDHLPENLRGIVGGVRAAISASALTVRR